MCWVCGLSLPGLRCFGSRPDQDKLLITHKRMNVSFMLDERKYSQCTRQGCMKINHNKIPRGAEKVIL